MDTGKDLAEDVIIEMPFAPPGRTRRYEGREKFLDFAAPERAAFVRQFTIEEVRNTVIHETTDQEVIVVEYELVGTIKATGRRASSPFVTVLRVRDGKTVHWREYQDTLPWPPPLSRPRHRSRTRNNRDRRRAVVTRPDQPINTTGKPRETQGNPAAPRGGSAGKKPPGNPQGKPQEEKPSEEPPGKPPENKTGPEMKEGPPRMG
ncbi:nuclear transport factor 2 family protein [Streptosporangium lutulentum]